MDTTNETPFSPVDLTLRDGRAVRLRAAMPADAADLVVIRQQIVTEEGASLGTDVFSVERTAAWLADPDPGTMPIVAEHAGQVVGSITLRPIHPGAFVQHLREVSITLHRDWRGNGLGSALIRAAAAWARATGIEMLLLGVLDTNPRARALYTRLGFRETGYIPRFVKYPDGRYAGDTQMMLDLVGGGQGEGGQVAG